jgi:hypothetical protein
MLFLLMVSGALLVLTPASALARHHHKRHHTRHHARARILRFGTAMPSQSGSGGNDAQTGQGSDQNAGMVAGLTNGTLTITLNDGSTVSGKVTQDTQIECDSSGSTTMHADDASAENSNSGDDDSGSADSGDDDAQEDQGAQSCSSSDLQPGTPVREAELKVSGAGATWDKVDLVTSQARAVSQDDR